MKVLRIYDQHRRDCKCDVECEACQHFQTYKYAYDDRNYWDNVIPNKKCENCGKSTKDLGFEIEYVATKYADYENV